MPNRLFLIRHGESTWNAEQRLQGGAHDPPLSDVGRRQARALAGLVAAIGVPADHVRCSDLTRARETAQELGVQVGRYDPGWREIDIGSWGGRISAEVIAESDQLTNWRGGPRTAPDGEPWVAFAARIAGAIADLAASDGSWLVICHGGCIRAACAHLTGADALALAAPPNASATSFELGDQPRLLTYGTLASSRPSAELG